MNKKILQTLFSSFAKRADLKDFKNKIRKECDMAYPTLWNYTKEKPTPVKKLVGEKIIEIVKRDYPEKVALLNKNEEGV